MPDITIPNKTKRRAVILSIEPKHGNLKIAKSLQVVRSFVCIIGKELLNENDGNELAVTRKRKEHFQLPTHSLTHSLTQDQ
ncbi:unnamed protein product [Hymenolepis diminuta]|uniref:Uncharacterized protein n=1 Tax=Hymenolepis diminuta TaxID=6216 RepID=A0A564Z5N9_HYMDI|nr:unnamed protein product [Hymenolepis diminuta]VUZ54831.1 unnamed protein product [Hymenolepis diminuta]